MFTSKFRITVVLSLIVCTLPWLGFTIWNSLPFDFRVNSNDLRYAFYGMMGIIIGGILFKKELKLALIPLLILFFTASNVAWNIDRFNSQKRDLETGKIEYPMHIPDCEKESNFDSFWDYIQHGCHITVDDFVGSLLIKVLIFAITLLIGRTALLLLIGKRKRSMDKHLIDQ